jgi:hypothetical protein
VHEGDEDTGCRQLGSDSSGPLQDDAGLFSFAASASARTLVSNLIRERVELLLDCGDPFELDVLLVSHLVQQVFDS